MPKTVLIPLVDLAEPGQASFLELWVEPAQQESGRLALQSLSAGPLRTAVAQARQALAGLPEPLQPALIRLMSPGLALSKAVSAGLGLALCPFLLDPAFPYSRYIITGSLGQPPAIGDSGHLRHSLEAVLRLGYQPEPALFILPRCALDESLLELCGQLASLNVAVRPVADLPEALQACTGRLEIPSPPAPLPQGEGRQKQGNRHGLA